MPEDAKVHVGNLSFDTREDDLQYEFERYGRVEQGKFKNFFPQTTTGNADTSYVSTVE